MRCIDVTPLKKGHPREEDRYMWGCGRSPHPHIYPSLILEGIFFSALRCRIRDGSAKGLTVFQCLLYRILMLRSYPSHK